MSENFSVYVSLLFSVILYLPQYCRKDVLCSSDIIWLVKFFHSEKNFPVRRFCTGIIIIISSYMTYAFSCLGTLLFCILYSMNLKQTAWGELSKLRSFPSQLTVYALFHVNYVAQKSAAGPASLHFHGHFFLHSLAHKRKKILIAGYQLPALIENHV